MKTLLALALLAAPASAIDHTLPKEHKRRCADIYSMLAKKENALLRAEGRDMKCVLPPESKHDVPNAYAHAPVPKPASAPAAKPNIKPKAKPAKKKG